jgi:ABC-type phosphate/phosphonate transport system substrate-binding protein
MKRIILFCLLCWPLINKAAEQELLFGVYTSDKPSDMVRKFKPLLNDLQQRLST